MLAVVLIQRFQLDVAEEYQRLDIIIDLLLRKTNGLSEKSLDLYIF